MLLRKLGLSRAHKFLVEFSVTVFSPLEELPLIFGYNFVLFIFSVRFIFSKTNYDLAFEWRRFKLNFHRRCRQDTHQLAVVERVHGTHKVIIRMRKQEYFLHPKPGVWWFINCVGMETGGAGLDVSKCLNSKRCKITPKS